MVHNARVSSNLPRLLLTALALLAPVPVARAGETQRPATLQIAAAASLTEVLPRLLAARGPGAAPAELRFDASSRLARQIEAGAPTDVFISADAEWVDYLARAGRVDGASRIDLAGNSLVVVVPRAAARPPLRVEDLAGPAVERVALAGESVPAGRYARAALESLKLWTAVKPKVVSGDSVRTALSWVARGEAAAAIVYATDARVEPRVRVAFALPATSHPPIVYPAVVVAGAAHGAEARVLLDFLRSNTARGVLAEAGFLPPPPSVRTPPGAPPPAEPRSPSPSPSPAPAR